MSIATIISVGLVILGLVIIIYRAYARIKYAPTIESHEKILTLTDANFDNEIQNKIILVDFWAAWCAPCRMMAPILNEMAAELPENYFVGKIDIEQNREIARRYGIRGIPTFIIFKEGKVAKTIVGVKSKTHLMKEMQSV